MHARSRRITALLLILALCLSLSLPALAETCTVTVIQPQNGDATVSKSLVELGETVRIKAIPHPGYRFERWELVSGRLDLDLFTAEQSIKPAENVELNALFVPDLYRVSVESGDLSGGSFSIDHRECAPGTAVSVTASPYEGYSLIHWTCDDEELSLTGDTELTVTFTMPARDVVLTAHFELIKYRFRVITGAGGKVLVNGRTPNGSGEYEASFGEEIELLAEPADNYLFSGWTASNGAELSGAESESVTVLCPASDFTIRAQFASAIKDLNVTSTEGGSVSPREGTMRLGVDNILELLAVPDEGYVFSAWECSSEEGRFSNPKSASATFTMPDADCTVTAVFVKGGYRLTLVPTVGGRVNDAAGNYEMGEQVPVVATPEAGYEFSRWECDLPGVVWDREARETVVTMPGEDVKLTAVFTLIGGSARKTDPGEKENGGTAFPWAALIAVLVLSGIAIALIVVRERYNLSYRYLFRKWLRHLAGRDEEDGDA